MNRFTIAPTFTSSSSWTTVGWKPNPDCSACCTAPGTAGPSWAREPPLPVGKKHVQSGSAPQWNPEKSLWEWWYKGYTTFTEDSLALYAT